MVFYIGSLLQAALLSITSYILNDHVAHEALGSQNRFNPNIPYDYIVIGSGPGGSVVASRLSENPAITVLLLEEGGPQTVTTDIPAMDIVNVLQPTDKVFQFLVEPQEASSQGFPDKRFNMLTGRALGGGTTVNGMMYNRGGKLDFDGWAKDYNATTWSYEEILPLFRRSQNQNDKSLLGNGRYHGNGGPLNVETTDFNQSSPAYKLLADTIVSAANEMGYETIDINGEHHVGVTRIQRMKLKGRRHSTATAYLQPAANRPNLHILTGAKATKILFDENRSAYAVTFECRGKVETGWVKRNTGGEIIVSAGAINSAKLLLLSGVGPKKDLEALGIPVVADLPVGQNFQDHARAGGVDFVCDKPLFAFWQDLLTVDNLEMFYVNGTGPLANNYYLHQDAVLNVQTIVPKRDRLFGPSDMFLAPAIVPPPFVLLTGGTPFLNKDILEKYYGPHFGKPTLNIYVVLNYIRSRGYIKLKSTNHADPPIVNPRYLTDQDDLDRVIEGYKIGMKLGDTPTFKALGCKPYEQALPGCEEFYNPESPLGPRYVTCKVKHLSASELHPTSSCPMGGWGDAMAVVDPTLRVQGGVSGLRVVDASVMPSIVTANPTAATIMIGEKASDMILADRASYSGLYYSGLNFVQKYTPYFYYQYV